MVQVEMSKVELSERQSAKYAFSVLVGQSALSEESTGLTGEDYNLLRLGMEYAYLNSAAAERSLERTDDYINQHRLSSFFARAIQLCRKVYVKLGVPP